MLFVRHFILTVLMCTVFISVAKAQALDLTTGQVGITGKDQITLENLFFDNNFYNATLQLNVDGTYQVNQIELVSLPVAVYEVTFNSTWSQQTHPEDFPVGSAHFSGLVGAAHNASSNFWKKGKIASSGIEVMAETGGKSALINEINTQIDSGHAKAVLSGGGISRSPGEVSITFEMTQQYPLVTLVSMIAPSPDWFVGVSGLSLIADGQWVDTLEVPLFAYDAGTDSGERYTSSNSDTQPKAAIQRFETAPFLVNGTVTPLGTFTFKRIE